MFWHRSTLELKTVVLETAATFRRIRNCHTWKRWITQTECPVVLYRNNSIWRRFLPLATLRNSPGLWRCVSFLWRTWGLWECPLLPSPKGWMWRGCRGAVWDLVLSWFVISYSIHSGVSCHRPSQLSIGHVWTSDQHPSGTLMPRLFMSHHQNWVLFSFWIDKQQLVTGAWLWTLADGKLQTVLFLSCPGLEQGVLCCTQTISLHLARLNNHSRYTQSKGQHNTNGSILYPVNKDLTAYRC